jgi:hypothetical protein
MKKKSLILSLVLSIFLSINAFSQFSFNDIKLWAGTGTNKAALVIEWTTPGGGYVTKVWGYKWSGTKTGRDMLNAIKAIDPRIFEKAGSYGDQTVFGLGYDMDCDGFTYVPGTNETGYAGDPQDVYKEGWMYQGYWSYWLSANGTSWSYSNYGIANRTLTNGSWDGWRFAYAPSWTANPPRTPFTAATACGSSKSIRYTSVASENIVVNESIEMEYDINISPNPCSDFINIYIEKPVQATILNLNGQVMFQASFNSQNPTVDVSKLEKGIYTLVLETAENKIYKRIIKN